MGEIQHIKLLEQPRDWQKIKVAGAEPTFSFKDTSDWTEGWKEAWTFVTWIAVIASIVFLVAAGLTFVSVSSAIAFIFAAMTFVPAVEINDGLHKHSNKLQDYANSLSNEWLTHKERGHGEGEDLMPYSTYAVDIIEDKPERYQMLEFRLQDEQGQYRVLADVVISDDLTVAAEQGVEIAALAKSMEEDAAAQYEKMRYAMEIDQAIEDEIELSKAYDDETRQYVIRSAVGKE